MMFGQLNIGRIFAHAVIRKLAYIAVALVIGWASVAEAQAACSTTDGHAFTCGNREQAYSAMSGQLSSPYFDNQCAGAPPVDKRIIGPGEALSNMQYRIEMMCSTTWIGTVKNAIYPTNAECPTGQQWNEASKTCAKDCANEAPLVGLFASNFSNGGKVCNFGCEFQQSAPKVDIEVSNGINSLRFGQSLGATPTGQACTAETPPNQPPPEAPECLVVGSTPNGNITHCPKPDGSSCIHSPGGLKFCTKPAGQQSGPKTDDGRTEGVSQSPDANTPPNAPANRPGENWTKTGPSTTITNNTENKSSVVNNYTNTGTPNPNGTPIPGDGSGTDGKGQQCTETSCPDGEGSASGGGTCAQPIQCAGDPIMCLQLTQTFTARCEADARYKALIGEIAPLDTFDGGASGVNIEDVWGTPDPEDDIDQSGYGFGTTCPEPPQFFGETLDISGICNIFQIIGLLVAAMGLLHGAYIVAGDV